MTIEFTFDLEGEIAKIECAPANPANVANPKDNNGVNSQDSQDSQPTFTKKTIPSKSNSQDSQDSQGYPKILHFLNDVEREVWQSYYDSAIGPKFEVFPEEASWKATEVLVKDMNALMGDEIMQNFERDGFLKIFSTKLDQFIYICRDSIVAKKVPESNITVFTFRELNALEGLDKEDALLLLQAKTVFSGYLSKPRTIN